MPTGIKSARKILEMRKDEEERTSQQIQFLNKTQYWPREKILEHQNNKLRELIAHAYNNVPFYHEMFRKLDLKPVDIKQKSDLHKLPLLTKKDIQSSLNELQATNMKENSILYRTGGSTGEPLQFYIERKMLSWSSAARYRAWEWCGYNMGDKTAMLWGSSFDLEKSSSMKGKLKDFVTQKITLNAFKMTDEDMNNYAKEIQKFRPKVIRSYSSALCVFARYIKEHDFKGIEPKSIITTAENLYSHQRDLIEEVFGCKVYDGYGARETSLIAHECEALEGYHVSDENSIVEYIKDGEPVVPGESGEIIITDLHNMVMPWIRYKIEDLGTPTDEKCSCGRTLSMMKSIDGRIHDVIVTPDGRRIPGEFFPHLFKDVDGIKEYQIIQKTRDKLRVEIVKGVKYKDADVQYLLKHMKEYLGKLIEIDVIFLDAIDWPESGKRRYTISEVVE